jgi:hypothetical protein
MRSSSSRLQSSLRVMLLVAMPALAFGQQANPNLAQLRITVVDETGGWIPIAVVRIGAPTGAPIEKSVDDRGIATFANLGVGSIPVHVEAGGFTDFDGTLTLRRGNNAQNITLKVAGVSEQVTVTDTTATDDRRGNALSSTLEEDDIAALSDDPDELAAQLEALTGGAGATFMVDGFRGGRLPPRDQIRQIRFRLNSFSADNHDAGRVQVEILTRPGLNAWAGNANFGFRDNMLNARNAFSRAKLPEQLRRFSGGLRGPLVRNRTALRLNVDSTNSFDSTTIVAQLPEGPLNDVVRRPLDQTSVTLNLEHGLSNRQTLRFEYRGTQSENSNLGVGDFSLTERAFTRSRDEHQIRATLQSQIGRTSLNQLHLQVNRNASAQVSVNPATALVVIDTFTRGGAGVSNETLNRTWQLFDDFDFNVRKHAMRVGFWSSGGIYQQSDNRNSNGTFTFASMDAYHARAANTYTQRIGSVTTDFNMTQLGLYWQDDFRISRTATMSVGVRQEMQTQLDDRLNVMPRFGFTWNPLGSRTTLRGGYGLFHDWLDANLYDQTLRVNGVTQYDLLILNPGYPDPFSGVTADVLPGGRVQMAPDMQMPFVHQVSLGVERPLTATLGLQASVSMQRGYHQFRSRNINAPDEFGVRPDPTTGQITQIESTGRSNLDRMTLGLNYRVPALRLFMNGNYTLASLKNHSDNPLSLPSNSLNPDVDWGSSSQDVRHRFNAIVNFPLPQQLRANINAQVSSAPPYNITTGLDDNRDGVSNDRPVGVSRNTARGANRVEMSTRISRGFGFGGAQVGAQGLPAGAGGGPALQQGPGGVPGGGGGGFGGPGAQTNQRYTVEFYVQASNFLNRTNYLAFSGNLQSPFYGRPTSATQARRLEVGMQFRF